MVNKGSVDVRKIEVETLRRFTVRGFARVFWACRTRRCCVGIVTETVELNSIGSVKLQKCPTALRV